MAANPAQQVGKAIRAEVAEAVREAESVTSAEIVTVLAPRSGRYERAEDLVGLVTAIVALAITSGVLAGGGGTEIRVLAVIASVLAVIAGYIVGVVMAAQSDTLRRLFASAASQQERTDERARPSFVDRRVNQTTGGTGIMVYVSLFERRGLIYADQAVRDHLPPGAVSELNDLVTQRVQAGDVAGAYRDAIARIAEILSEVMPRYEDDMNELPDGLVVLD